jgi:methyl-accepting chemotaxis protein
MKPEQQRALAATAVLAALFFFAIKAPEQYQAALYIGIPIAVFAVLQWLVGAQPDKQQASELRSALRDKTSQLARVERRSEQLHERIVSARGVFTDLARNMKGTGEEIDGLGAEVDSALIALRALLGANEASALQLDQLGLTVQSSVAPLEELAQSIKSVARSVDALALTAEQTSSSITQMDASIDQVQLNASETARLSEEVSKDADLGADAISKTIGEINRIKESSLEAVLVIQSLTNRMDAIGEIVGVIDDVAEQTNLLALNAAIIAAQAGEQGKGFAVVADEIKDLAERAATSTKEISDLIKTIQNESRNAMIAVQRGADNVDRGVRVSNDAERALKKILDSSRMSTERVRAIARATVEHAKGSRQVTDAIGRIAETVSRVAVTTTEQAKGAELLSSGTARLRSIAAQVSALGDERRRAERDASQALEELRTRATQTRAATVATRVARDQMDDDVKALSSADKSLRDALAKRPRTSDPDDFAD